jgi:hypothetical protein
MSRRRTRAPRVFLLTILVCGLSTTGCQQLQQILGGLLGGGGGGILNPAGGAGGTLNPGGILGGNGIGNGGPLAPNSLLPAPQASQATIQQITAQYGVQIYGDGAQGQFLQTVQQGLLHYPVDKVQGLGSINMPLLRGTQGVLGDWSVSGGPAHINFYVQQGRQNPLWNNTVVHELGHHSTLYHEQFGDAFYPLLAQGNARYPSGYARSSRAELLAETMAFALLGDRGYERPDAGWALTQAGKAFIEREIVAKRPPPQS